MKYLLQILLIGISFNTIAQIEAYINDEDGYTNVREGKSINMKVIATIQNAELFVCVPDRESEWWKIEKNDGTIGYVHHSRIVEVASQATIIQKHFSQIENAIPKNVEFEEGSNELLFMYAERYPKSFLLAFDQSPPLVREKIINELESPIHDLIDLELIYERISAINGNEASRISILNALEVAGQKMGINITKK